jgi:hypothetical protein
MSSLTVRNNPYAGPRATIGPSEYAAELPIKNRYRAPIARTVPPILDIRPIDIYTSITRVYRIPGILAAPFKSSPRTIVGQ